MNISEALLEKEKIEKVSKNPEKHLKIFRKSLLFSIAMYLLFLIIQFIAILVIGNYVGWKFVPILIGYNILSTITKLHWDNAQKVRKLYDIADKLVNLKIKQEKEK